MQSWGWGMYLSVCSRAWTCKYMDMMYTESIEPSKTRLGRGLERRHFKSLKAPGAEEASGKGHILVCAERPDLALLLPFIDLLCDLRLVTYPLWALDSVDNH